jgi:hypothetical protein
MENKNRLVNRGVFCGKVTSDPVLDHQIKNDTGELIKEYHLVEAEVMFENKTGTVKDTSILPFLVTKEQMDEINGISIGDILFIKGEYRAYDRKLEEGKRKTVTRVNCKKIEKIEDFTRTRNKIEFEGILKSKLFKVEFNDEGQVVRDEKGKLKPVLDEDGKRISAVRKNADGHTVNDFILQVSKEVEKEDGVMKSVYRDFIPCISYGPVAKQIQNEIEVDVPVKARGYIRRRPKNGYTDEYVYEPVITRITPMIEDKENE